MAEKSKQGPDTRRSSARRPDAAESSPAPFKSMASPHPQDEVEIEIETVSEQEFLRGIEREEARNEDRRR
jgi:hypothetical protein